MLNFAIGPKALFLQVNYTIEIAQHDLEKHWSGEFSYTLSEFFSITVVSVTVHHTVVQNRMTKRVAFLSKTATSYVLLAKQRSVFIPGEAGHSILVAFLAGVRKGRKKVIIKCCYVQKKCKHFYSCSSPKNNFFLKLSALSCCFHCNIIS